MIEGKIAVTERSGRRCKQLLNGLEETRRYWKLKAVTLHPTTWRTRLRRSCGPVVRPCCSQVCQHKIWFVSTTMFLRVSINDYIDICSRYRNSGHNSWISIEDKIYFHKICMYSQNVSHNIW